ncbi:mycofactocin biosynthesis peptidyl-dipeptidase MftE [Allobranchiibius sp. CTAmp26]|uniref:mycofactocin biosynthesis peptidyl-dipeptidase MftE n=1 Tax=Allobranchiibius sp. CTAmp26 TaxID=2815214 RepID=UPI001AA0BD8F|nr:mycofactocin biosynthesis peptidyl-dipeptidase MftE [Allobranchiibius sp. CTAmp26]MBO1753918.1 mycofactocin biosynthesis peptidyl-dipeptidase MftE [Allobranchiibius sp. CTAmp26]
MTTGPGGPGERGARRTTPGPPAPADQHLPLAQWTSPQACGGPLLIVPVGSLEQHGPHLPLDTDSAVATAVATAAAALLTTGGESVAVAPVVAYGASGEHQDFAGTVSIGRAALTALLVEIGRSAGTWAARMVFVNGHGGNAAALRDAVRLLRAESRDASWVPAGVPGADAHAGHVETSIMLHLRPGSVDMTRAVCGTTTAIEQLLPALRESGVRAVSPTGILGDPRGADAAQGARLCDRIADDVTDRIRRGTIDDDGLLVIQTRTLAALPQARRVPSGSL